MGVTITATNPKYEFDMGYFGFLQLRKEIALANKEFGRNYADLMHCHTQKEYETNEKTANRIIQENHLDRYADVLDFLYMPDSEGEVGYKNSCGNILRLIRDRKDSTGFRYGSMQHNDWEEFKEFLGVRTKTWTLTGTERNCDMYSRKQVLKALRLYRKCGSVTKTIIILGYPSRESMYLWIRNSEYMNPRDCIDKRPPHKCHLTIAEKEYAVKRCFYDGESVKLVSEELGCSTTSLYLW